MNTQPEALQLADWHKAMADEPKRNEAKRDKHRRTEAELRRLHEAKQELIKAYRKMYNAAAGYSNYCEESASVRRCERDFEEADAIFRAAIAKHGGAA